MIHGSCRQYEYGWPQPMEIIEIRHHSRNFFLGVVPAWPIWGRPGIQKGMDLEASLRIFEQKTPFKKPLLWMEKTRVDAVPMLFTRQPVPGGSGERFYPLGPFE